MNTERTKSILVVEDDPDLAGMVAEFLNGNGFAATIESNGMLASQRIVSENPDAVVLDVNLPGMNGFDVCRTVRDQYRGPILILTARGDEVDEVIGLEIGADDYLSKPVRPRVLLARLRAQLRKAPTSASNRSISVGNLTIDSGTRITEIAGEELDLTTAEFDLLWCLAERVGEVVSRESIYQDLVGIPYDGVDRSIDLRVSRLRRKLKDDPVHPERIKSIRGVGYMLVFDK
ncbi:MAG: response regulator [Planctomycetaceae bacterium]